MLCVSNRWDWKCCSGLGKKGSLYLQALNTDFSANRWFVWLLKYEVITAKKSRLSKLNLGSWCWSCTQKLELATRKVFEKLWSPYKRSWVFSSWENRNVVKWNVNLVVSLHNNLTSILKKSEWNFTVKKTKETKVCSNDELNSLVRLLHLQLSFLVHDTYT